MIQIRYELILGPWLLILPFFLVLGCSQARDPEANMQQALNGGIEEIPGVDVERQTYGPDDVLGDNLITWAVLLDSRATERSSAVQEYRAAEAFHRARRFDRYPQLRPSASAPLGGQANPTVALNIDQVLWDSGSTRARLSEAQLSIEAAQLQAWADRNSSVADGLAALVNIARLEARLDEIRRLDAELAAIENLFQARLEGGVSDRGELLRLGVAQQEIARQSVADSAALRQAYADLQELLPPGTAIDVPTLSSLANHCHRGWPDREPLSDAIARTEAERAALAEQRTRSQRFPRLLLTSGTSNSGSGWSEPTIGLQLDASQMLGLGRRGDLEAAAARTRAAETSYSLQQEQTRAEIARQALNLEGLESDAASLQRLSEQSRAALELYEEQLDAASISLTDGIVLHREYTDTRLALYDIEANKLLNCLGSAEMRGLLAPIEIRRRARD